MHERATSGSDTDPVGLVYIPQALQDAPTPGECMGGGQQEGYNYGREGASNASSGEGSVIGDLSEDADNSESDNEPVRERRPQRSTRGQLPVRYRDVYVLK